MPAVAATTSTNVCGVGSAACIRAVVAEMTRRLRRARGAMQPRGAVRADVPPRDAGGRAPGHPPLRQPRSSSTISTRPSPTSTSPRTTTGGPGGRALVPEAWRIAFDAADHETVATLGDILLGMNAHISRDLPFALARTGLVEPDGRAVRPTSTASTACSAASRPGCCRRRPSASTRTLTSTVLPAIQFGPSNLAAAAQRLARRVLAKRRATARGANARATRPGRAHDRARRRGARAADRFTHFEPRDRPRCRAAQCLLRAQPPVIDGETSPHRQVCDPDGLRRSLVSCLRQRSSRRSRLSALPRSTVPSARLV